MDSHNRQSVPHNGKHFCIWGLGCDKTLRKFLCGESEVPSGIRRGQTLRIRLELGNPGQALLLPMGGFYQETGGNWVYVLNADGSQASKKSIRLGRKNPEYFEVTDGLKPGDRVITSSYTNFGDNEVLILK